MTCLQRRIWLEEASIWGGYQLVVCDFCDRAYGPMAVSDARAWAERHADLNHRAGEGTPAPSVYEEAELACATGGCWRRKTYRDGLCRAHHMAALRARRRMEAAA